MWLDQLLQASFDSAYMIALSGIGAVLGGLPLGVALFMSGRAQHRRVYPVLSLSINIIRSVPFIILLVALMPLTRIVVGTSIGTTAALVPLTIAAIPFFARLVEGALLEIPTGMLDAAYAMGASPYQLVHGVLLREARGSIINAVTVTLVNLVGYSAMAGAIGGGGLGDLAIRYGYQRFDMTTMLVTIAVLVVLVQGIQIIGELASRRARRE